VDPEKVEDYLSIKNTVESRKDEIEKQKKQAVKENARMIKRLRAQKEVIVENY
jgi:hypothetical protein